MPSDNLSRREFHRYAVAIGATLVLAGRSMEGAIAAARSDGHFPQGVASGDPTSRSIVLWTRYVDDGQPGKRLMVEVSTTSDFRRIVARRQMRLRPGDDGCSRVLLAGLRPSTLYWYRFIDVDGNASRTGRTRTAPEDGDARPVRFAFVSCQNITMGPMLAWRRMIFDDERSPADEQIEFVLNLGDFVYNDLWYPEDRPTYFDRKVTEKFRYQDGERHDDFHVPTSLEDYRILYRAYLQDPHIQDARARWPFISIWDNGEFSNKGWQAIQRFGSESKARQTRKVAANQAWFDYMPARLPAQHDQFHAPVVSDQPVDRFDANGLGIEENNVAAIRSLLAYRAIRWGKNVELLITDQRSFRSDDYTNDRAAASLADPAFPQMVPFETLQILDAGRSWAAGNPPAQVRTATGNIPNYLAATTPRTMLGSDQKRWFLDRLGRSAATWKIWANTVATFDMRADPANLPEPLAERWAGGQFAGYARNDFSTAFVERREIFDFVKNNNLSGFVTLSGDRHSFWAGYSSASLPPEGFEPVGLNFVTGSINSPGMAEAFEYGLAKDHLLRSLYLVDRPGAAKPVSTVNLLLKHGVRSCLEYAKSGDLEQARRVSNPANAPHVRFVDMAGHGFSKVLASADEFAVEFVCIERPVSDTGAADGGPLRYRVLHRSGLGKGYVPAPFSMTLLEGDVGTAV